MEKKLEELIEKLSELPSLTKKTSTKMIIDFLKKENKNKDLEIINELLMELKFCKKCNKITSNDNSVCNSCQKNNSETLILIKNHLDFINLEKHVEQNNFNSYILNIDSKASLIKFLSFDENYKKLSFFLENTTKIKEIIFSFSITSENDLLSSFIQENFKDKYNFYVLGKGLPLGNSINYIDQDTLKFAFLKKEKI